MIDSNRLQTLFITSQFFVMQGVIPEQIFNFINRIHNIYHADISTNNLWLKPMFLVTCLAFVEKLTKIILFKKDFHNRDFAAKVVKKNVFANFANIIFAECFFF